MEKKNGKVTLSFVNKPLEFIGYEFKGHEIRKTINDENIKKTLKIMKNRKFSSTNQGKTKNPDQKDGQSDDPKNKKNEEKKEEEEDEEEGKVDTYY